MKKTKSMIHFSAVTLGILHCINKAIDSASIIHSTTKSSGKYYHWSHGDIYYQVSGQGKPLLLVHDLNVLSSGSEWSKIVNQLAECYTVYSIDLIGCGRSDKPSITYTNYFYVQMITDFIHHIVKEKTAVIATGVSTSFVLMANAMNDCLFNSIMLINPPTAASLKDSPDKYSKVLMRLFDLPVIGKTVYYIATNKANIEYYLSENCFYNPFELKPTTLKAYYDAAHTGNGNGKYLLASLKGHYLNIDITKALKNAKNKIVLLNGEHYKYIEEVNATYLKLNENIIKITVNGTNYLPQLENPTDTVKLIKDLL